MVLIAFLIIILGTIMINQRDSFSKAKYFLKRKEVILLTTTFLLSALAYAYLKGKAYMTLLERISTEINPLEPPFTAYFYSKYMWPLLKEPIIYPILALISAWFILEEGAKKEFLVLEAAFFIFLITMFAVFLEVSLIHI